MYADSLLMARGHHQMTASRGIFVGLDIQPDIKSGNTSRQAVAIFATQSLLYQFSGHFLRAQSQRDANECCMLLSYHHQG